MKFIRPKIIRHDPVAGSFDANGNPTTTPVIVQTERTDLILGDGATSFDVIQKDGSVKTVQTVDTTTAFSDENTWELQINGNRQIFVTLNVEDLGAAASGVRVLIEFQDPDHTEFWIPSKEGINRESSISTHEWALTGTGNWVVASRVEHRHFKVARVRFKMIGGDADASTKVVCSWTHDGGRSMGELYGNDPSSVL